MKKIKMIIAIILIIVVGAFGWFNLYSPCKISKKNAKITISAENNDDNEEYNDEKYNKLLNLYKNGKIDEDVSDMRLVRMNGGLPSKYAKDYRKISLSLKITNRSFLKINDFECFFLDNDPDDNILYSDRKYEVIHDIRGLKIVEDVPVIRFEMYVGDMSDEEIIDYIKTKEIYIIYKHKFVGIEDIKISLKDLDIKVVD